MVCSHKKHYLHVVNNHNLQCFIPPVLFRFESKFVNFTVVKRSFLFTSRNKGKRKNVLVQIKSNKKWNF